MKKILALFVILAVTSAHAEEGQDLIVPDITVYGIAPQNALHSIPTVSELSGLRLERKKTSTLGETLSRETGVNSSQFGPNSSRPVIRGLEGDRVRVLQNGIGVLDASTLSQDHATAVDPLVVERLEIVRGPAALLYGSSAIGGVVNVVTTRLPEKRPESLELTAESQFSSHDLGRSGGVGVTVPVAHRWALHADGTLRAADDYDSPEGRIYNSFNRTQSGALGASYIFESGYVGTSIAGYHSTYGTVADEAVQIEMQQRHWDVAGEFRFNGFLKSIKGKNSFSKYKHEEIEEGSVGTIFKNEGNETRVELAHRELGPFLGVFGLQSNLMDFDVEGDEAFLPKAESENFAVFLFEEVSRGRLRPSFGARIEANKVSSESNPIFGDGLTRSFTGTNFSTGLIYQLSSDHAVAINGAYTERSPTHEELFANGRHVATAQFESGDANLRKERGQSVEVSWRHDSEASRAHLVAFVQDFEDFISLMPTGTNDSDPEEPFDIFQYQAVGARLYGLEGEYTLRFRDFLPRGIFEIEMKMDLVQGVNRDLHENLPLMPPMRETVAFVYKTDLMTADLEVQRSEKQTKLAPFETQTKSYTRVNMGVDVPISSANLDWGWSFRVHNIFDVEAKNHISVLKDKAPLPGRSFILGLKLEI